MCNIKNYEQEVDKIKDAFNSYFKLMEQWDNDIKEVNGSICDSYHYMEFNDLDVVKGYKAYKELQQKLQTRRKLKTNLDYLRSVSNEFKMANDTFKNLDKKYADPTYKPRVNDELFQAESAKTIGKASPIRTFSTLEEAAEFLKKAEGKRAKLTKLQAAIEYGKTYHGHIWELGENNKIMMKKCS